MFTKVAYAAWLTLFFYTLHGWDLDVSGVIRLLHCFSPRARASLHSAAALAPRGLRAKVKLPTQAMSNTHPRGVYEP